MEQRKLEFFVFFCNVAQNDVAKASAGKTAKGGTAIHSNQNESLRGWVINYSAHSTLKSRFHHHTPTQPSTPSLHELAYLHPEDHRERKLCLGNIRACSAVVFGEMRTFAPESKNNTAKVEVFHQQGHGSLDDLHCYQQNCYPSTHSKQQVQMEDMQTDIHVLK